MHVFTWTLAGAVLVGCRRDDNNPQDENPTPNIVQIAQSNPDFSILVQALTRSDLSVNFAEVLSGEGPFTVFAPTNAAFQALLTELNVPSLNDIPAPVLEAVLTYHVVAGSVRSGALTNGQVVTTLNTGTFTVNTQGGVTITDANGRTANVIQTDIVASNGIIHVIDKVILPELGQGAEPNIVQIAQNNPDFSILVQALTRADLSVDFVEILSGEGPFTVFAPTNAAFQALLTELNFSSLNDIPAATLEAVLKYHVVSGEVKSTALTNGQVVTTLNTGTFTVNIQGGVTITDANQRTANVTAADIIASNGVIHVIDRVILPPL